MTGKSLQQLLDSVEDPIDRFRNQDVRQSIWSFPDEQTHWIEEQRAWRETCVLADQSHHMMELTLEGPDALDVYEDLGVNTFEDFRTEEPPQAKQLVVCNPNGYLIGDCILFYLEENRFLSVGTSGSQNWIRYNVDTGDYDATTKWSNHPRRELPPTYFRFEIQGPNASDVIEDVLDGSPPEISFFSMDTVTINGQEVYALGHGMAGEKGLEIFGPIEHKDEIKAAILDAGEEYGIKELGSKSYKTTPVESGWIPRLVPAIYTDEELKPYREWLDEETLEANLSVGGSYDSKSISDYYLTPTEVGYDHIINFDYEFIGKEALENRSETPRTKVTLVWEPDDVVDIFASLFEDDLPHKFIDWPDTSDRREMARFDEVKIDEQTIGVSKWSSYNYNERAYLSLAVIDEDYSEPGTEVTVVWSDKNSSKSKIERHSEAEVQATVAPAPYVTGREDI